MHAARVPKPKAINFALPPRATRTPQMLLLRQGPNAELSGRRRAQHDGNPTAQPLGAPLERRVRLPASMEIGGSSRNACRPAYAGTIPFATPRARAAEAGASTTTGDANRSPSTWRSAGQPHETHLAGLSTVVCTPTARASGAMNGGCQPCTTKPRAGGAAVASKPSLCSAAEFACGTAGLQRGRLPG